ncbi:glycosyltransferase [Flavobacterium sp.]|uniref:glycosyltransferase n=1 Tax=Flavobacterium sp. TaxID=239 RepID=UPI00286DCE42|nr:glycosyltransferase [Flavobacterium sp.]
MIRILHIQETMGSGGVERLRLSLSKLLDKEKYLLKIICTHTGGGIKEEIESFGVEVIAIGKFKGIFDYKKHREVQKTINTFQPHIIHGAVFEGVTMAAINGFIKRVPIVIIEETSDPKNRSWRANLLMRFFAKLSDAVVGVSPAVVQYLENTLKLPKHKIILINNGVVLPRDVSALEIAKLKVSLGIAPNDFVIGSVGRMILDEHKRFSDLIKAFAIVCKTQINAKLVLVGAGPEMVKYKKLSEELTISDKVIFTGYQSDVALYYRIMNIFVLASAYEAFGLVLTEAMLCKLPIVATRVGGMKYIVDNTITGFLVQPFDINAIAEKLNVLCFDEELRTNLGNMGFIKAMNNYTEQQYVNNLLDLYERLLLKSNVI